MKGPWPRWIVTFGGAGLSPVAPGTAGSIAATFVLLLAYQPIYHANPSQAALGFAVLLLAGLALSGALCVALGRWTADHFGRKDPGACVLDEAAGICLTALFCPIYPAWHEARALLVALVCFRIFDVLKPPPARRLERLPEGWGILMDDLMAGLYANLASQLVLRIVLPAIGI